MNRGTISDWKIGRLFTAVMEQRPDVTMGLKDEHLIFHAKTRTTVVNMELVRDCASIHWLATTVLSGLVE